MKKLCQYNVCLNGYITIAFRIEWSIHYRACRCSIDSDTQCNTILPDNIVQMNTNYKPVYAHGNCFKVN